MNITSHCPKIRGFFIYFCINKYWLPAGAIEKEALFPGSKIAYLSPNSSEYIVAQWAIWMVGGVAVPLCKSHPLSSLRYDATKTTLN